MGKAAVLVVVFDFDRTLIDCDSDNWVVTEMGLTQLFRQLYPTMPWTSLMNRMMRELHSQGKSVEDIAECLKRVPLHPQVISSIRAVHSHGCQLKIVSDANRFFIETILKQHGLLHCFSEIITNPAFEDEEGRLRIVPFHDTVCSPHGCSLCPPNMCKGIVLDRFLASELGDENTRFIYLGDGKGDYCPCLKLRTQDFLMPRKGFPLWEKIWSNRNLVKAQVHEWSNGDDLARTLIDLLDRILKNLDACPLDFTHEAPLRSIPL
ncbi:hypothetical protein CRG98_017418 [Punica granatum]|nr:hypothetical protein CRG98_017418 [Punica granatum]